MDVRTPLPTNQQPAEAVQPREDALDFPSVPPQLLRVDPAASEARNDPPPTAGVSIVRRVLAFPMVSQRGELLV